MVQILEVQLYMYCQQYQNLINCSLIIHLSLFYIMYKTTKLWQHTYYMCSTVTKVHVRIFLHQMNALL